MASVELPGPASRVKNVAIDDLPLPVVNLLNEIGVPWPYLNEDTISEFASLVRGFQSSIERTHTESSEAVAAITRAHQSVSAEAMQSGWTSLTARHVAELTAGCSMLADALDMAAGYIVAQKAEAVGVLVGMAAAFVADQAAAVVTFDLAEAAVPAIVAGAEAVVRSLAHDPGAKRTHAPSSSARLRPSAGASEWAGGRTGNGTDMAWKYINETVALLPVRAPKLPTAVRKTEGQGPGRSRLGV